MNNSPLTLKIFAASTVLNLLFFSYPALSQSPSPKSVQIDPDWEKIRDAQVQMLRKKEAELDRMKEELLTRAQPQAQVQTSLSEIEADFKKHETEWSQKNDRYENEITLLKVKIGDQKKEIDTLRIQLNDVFKKQPPGQQEKVLDQRPADLERRELQLKLQEKQFQDKFADTETQRKQFEADRNAFKIQKALLEKDKVDSAAETEAFKSKLKDLKGASVQAQALLKRENDILSRERELSQKQSDVQEKEKRVIESQKTLVEEKRNWVNQKTQTDNSLQQKAADAESRLIKVQDDKRLSEAGRQLLEKQVSSLQTQLRESRDNAAERESKWKKREQDLLQAQAGGNSQVVELRARLAKEQADFSQKDTQLKSQVEGLSQKLAQSDAQLKETDLRLKDKVVQLTNQNSARENEWAAKLADLEKRKADLTALEIQFKNKNDAMEAQSVHLEEKSKALQAQSVQMTKQGEIQAKERTEKLADLEKKKADLTALEMQFKNKSDALEKQSAELEKKSKVLRQEEQLTSQKENNRSAVGSGQTSSEVLGLRQKLNEVEKENKTWRQDKRQFDQNWSEFISKEMQYKMEIKDLNKRNQELQNQSAAAFAVSQNSNNDKDWSAEARRVADERRVLGEEKARLYRQLTQDRQDFEQSKVQFSRAQREFEQHVHNEEARLEKLRRQSVR